MIQEYENTLRRIINQILGTEDNTDFKVSHKRLEKWKEKREIETKKYKGFNPEMRIIYYSDFYDLKTIIIKNWEKFKEILINKRRFEVLFDLMENFRNTISHGRKIMSYEENMVKGITGDLKTTLTRYHNKNENKDDFFIKILKISDNLGNCIEHCKKPLMMLIVQGELRVGDYLEIDIEAHDPKDREIEYRIFNENIDFKNNNGKFQLNISNKMVGNPCHLNVIAKTKGSEYENKDNAFISYVILPKG